MTTAGWNVLLYAIAGDDKEHKVITEAIADMHGALTTDQCNVVVQLHSKSKTTRHSISAGRKVHTELLPSVVDASDPASLTSFLNTTNRTFPGRSNALVLWAHSNGLDYVHDSPPKKAPRDPGHRAVFGGREQPGLGGGPGLEALPGRDAASYDPARFGPGGAGVLGRAELTLPPPGRPDRFGCRWGPDPNTNKHLTNIGMKKAIAASTRRRVEILALNACWMGSLEIEYELRSVADVQIASQVYAFPWPYGAIIAMLAAAPELPAEELAKEFVASVRAEIVVHDRKDAISALRSGAAMDELASAFEAYARRALALIDSDWPAVRHAVMEGALRVDDPYQVDLMSLIHTLGSADLKTKIAAASVASKYRAMLLANVAANRHGRVHGLSIFCPKSTTVDLEDAYRGTEFRSNSWAQFLKAFQIRLAREPIEA